MADGITDQVGSNLSIIVHTFIFLAFAWLYYAGVDPTQLLLILTTLVSVEVIGEMKSEVDDLEVRIKHLDGSGKKRRRK